MINTSLNTKWKKEIILFITSQTITLFGSSLVQFAIIWHITLETQSGLMMTIGTISAFLPQLLISVFAGVWADRYNRKKLIILADGLIAFATFVLAIIYLTGYGRLWHLFLISGVRSMGAGIQMPAVSAVIPQIVPSDKLLKVSGIQSSIDSFILLLSPVASGIMLTKTPLEMVFFVDVITAIIGVSLLMTLHIPLHENALRERLSGYFDNFKDGIKYVKKSPAIKSLLAFNIIFFFLLVPVAFLTPLMVARTFGDDVWRLTVNEIAFFSGSILGGIGVSTLKNLDNRILVVGLSCAFLGAFTFALGLSTIFVIYLFFMFLSGLLVPFFSSSVTVFLQERVETSMQGRIFSLSQIIITAILPLGMTIWGPIADIVRIEVLFIITGILLNILGVIIVRQKKLNST